MPKIITKLASGVWETTRTHRMNLIPGAPGDFKPDSGNAPNACLACHEISAPAL
jgi:hypothetical protein